MTPSQISTETVDPSSSRPDSSQHGTLYVVGTPIGNLEDMTFRAVRILQEVDAIAAEDTRHTARLLQHFQITTRQLSYHQHNRTKQTPRLIERLQRGESIAVVTDAGMPGISDPGGDLVAACVAVGIGVVPVPGVSASITALSVSGLDSDRFAFDGFLPTKTKPRRLSLEALARETRTTILYEAPHRIRQTLVDLARVCGDDRQVAIGRELTKRYEEIWRGSLAAAVELYDTRKPQGEYTLTIAGALPTEMPTLSEVELKLELQRLIGEEGLSRSQACQQLAQQTQQSRRELYQLAIELEVLPNV
ncbi:MAG: 16S rRNA (cytidine(1402)-2'-O)-methyltransferase [Coleofasciculaceae cyanobacterium RL_1_1]|nr:16S rRNA (cytidine(1402)-2'-O)-methyltransferase [Coleofasciculaceae cyanobacterium RL_1_1]